MHGDTREVRPTETLDWKALAAFPGTLAIYMGIARLPVIISELLRHGKPPDTPAGIIERASTGEQRSVFATLAALEDARRGAGLEAPARALVGVRELLELGAELLQLRAARHHLEDLLA